MRTNKLYINEIVILKNKLDGMLSLDCVGSLETLLYNIILIFSSKATL